MHDARAPAPRDSVLICPSRDQRNKRTWCSGTSSSAAGRTRRAGGWCWALTSCAIATCCARPRRIRRRWCSRHRERAGVGAGAGRQGHADAGTFTCTTIRMCPLTQPTSYLRVLHNAPHQQEPLCPGVGPAEPAARVPAAPATHGTNKSSTSSCELCSAGSMQRRCALQARLQARGGAAAGAAARELGSGGCFWVSIHTYLNHYRYTHASLLQPVPSLSPTAPPPLPPLQTLPNALPSSPPPSIGRHNNGPAVLRQRGLDGSSGVLRVVHQSAGFFCPCAGKWQAQHHHHVHSVSAKPCIHGAPHARWLISLRGGVNSTRLRRKIRLA